VAIHQYLYVLPVIEQYVLELMDCTAVNTDGVYAKTQESVSEASSHMICFIHSHSSSGKVRVVIGPNHGPRVDVEHGTTLA